MKTAALRSWRFFVSSMTLLWAITSVLAGEPFCREALDLRIKECNNTSIEEIDRKGQDCDLASRLKSFARWLETHEKPCSTIVKDVESRYQFYTDTTRYPLDYSDVEFEGSGDAPVKIVAYVSMSCPLCKRLYRDIADSIRAGDKSRKIALCAKPFSNTPLEQALVATRFWKKQGELLRALAPLKERVTLPIIMRVADSLDIPLPEFKKQMKNREVIDFVNASRTEVLKNGVTLTPTFFINGKRYQGYKDACWIIDAAEYEYGNLKKESN